MITAFIPAKSVSCRVPGKNMIDLGSKPLLLWSLEACKIWGIFDEVVVATDSDKIASFALSCGATKIYPLTNDDIEDKRTVMQLTKAFCKTHQGNIVLLHVTNPFRKKQEMTAIWNMFKSKKYDIVQSVREERQLIIDELAHYDGPHEACMTRLTQNVSPKYILDGSYAIFSCEYLAKVETFLDGKVGLFPVSRISGIEIDYLEDLEVARCVANGIKDWWQTKGNE